MGYTSAVGVGVDAGVGVSVGVGVSACYFGFIESAVIFLSREAIEKCSQVIVVSYVLLTEDATVSLCRGAGSSKIMNKEPLIV